MKFYFKLLFFTLCYGIANAQTSIHQEENLFYQNKGLTPADYEISNALTASKRLSTSNCNLTKTVYGWHPYWQNGMQSSYQWNLLSHLCYFSYEVDAASGNATTTNGWNTAQVITDAKNQGVKVTLCVTLFSNHSSFFSSNTAQNTLITNLVSLVQARGANGVNIDFEGMTSSHKTSFATFMNNLADAFHTQLPGSEVSTVLYAVDWSAVFDITAMSNKVDQFILMGYDYYYSGSTTAGPNDPLYNFSTEYNYTLSRSVNYYLNLGCPKQKLILGLPYYGREFGTQSSLPPSLVNNSPNSSSKTFSVIMNNAGGVYTNNNKKWDFASSTPYFVYHNGTEWRQCFYNDAYSLGKRMDLIVQRGMGGMGIWALGYDNGFQDYWQQIEDHFTDCSITACQDSIFDLGGPIRNYYDKENYSYSISPQGATALQLNFTEFNLEPGYDSLFLYNGNSTNAPLIGHYTGTLGPGTITTTTGSITLKFKSDNATTKSGFKAFYQCIMDHQPPVTQVLYNNQNWITKDTTINFSDTDSGLGVQETYYSINQFNNHWHSNAIKGFRLNYFKDQQLPADWKNYNGTWIPTDSCLIQSDQSSGNTILSAPLNQDSTTEFLYWYKAQLFGNDANKRAGFHFYCSNDSLANRGNSYFIWLRENNNKIQIYKVVNDTFSLKTDTSFTLLPSVWYDIKVTYNKVSGLIAVYLNNELAAQWTDPLPYTNGQYISFRSGNSGYRIKDLFVFKNRGSNALVKTGNSMYADLQFSNPEPTVNAALVRSVNRDKAGYWSEQDTLLLPIDLTPPEFSGNINDGAGTDLDTTTQQNGYSANWLPAIDNNSGISQYQIAIGTSPGGEDILPFYNLTTPAENNSTLVLDTGIRYYITVKAINNAGLKSTGLSSDGFVVHYTPAGIKDRTEKNLFAYPTLFSNGFYLKAENACNIVLTDATGKELPLEILSQKNSFYIRPRSPNLSQGCYFLRFNSNGKYYTQLLIKQTQ